MALPSFAPENVKPAPSSATARVFARIKSVLAERHDSRLAQFVAGKVFLVRVGSALLALVSQVLLARWMGSFEFGIYIYVWTWVLMIGALSDVGLSSAARRFIPEYAELKNFDRLRGFLSGSRWLAFGMANRDRPCRCIWRLSSCTMARPFRFISPVSQSRPMGWCRCRPASRSPMIGPPLR